MKIEIDKPVIPQFVANWIEKYIDYGYDLYPVLKKMENNARGWERTYDWYRNNTLEFVLAYLTQEYEVEQQPRYYAKIKGWEHIGTSSYYFGYDEDNDSLEVTYLESNYRFAFSLTHEHWNKLGINSTNADFEAVE